MNFISSRLPLFRRALRLTFLNTSLETVQLNCSSQYELSLACPLPSGWYLLKPEGKLCFTQASIFLDLGVGYEEAYELSLNCINDVVNTSVVDLPSDVRAMRLKVKTLNAKTEGRSSFSLTPIHRIEAVARIAYYIYQINRLRDISLWQVLLEKTHQVRKAGVMNIIRNLGGFYDYGDTEGPLGYVQWIRRNERLDDVTRQKIRKPCFVKEPLISAVCSYKKNIDQLVVTIQSLLDQTYTNWQLVLVVAEQESACLAEEISQFKLTDKQLKLIVIESDGFQSSMQDVLPVLDGEYCLWIREGDRLSPYGLHWFVDAINVRPDVVAWYCDSDFLDADGQRKAPCFRPDWNEELFYSQDYIGNCCLFSLPVVMQVVQHEDLTCHAEIYDLLLRILARGQEGQIAHVAKLLYHQASGSKKRMERPDNVAGQQLALKKYFAGQGQDVEVAAGLLPYTHRILPELPNELPHVTVVVPTRDHMKILKKCITTLIRKTEYPNFDVLVVDNGSTESATKKYLAEIQLQENIRVVEYDREFNFAAINNYGVSLTDAEMICMLNNDIEITAGDWLLEMVRYGCQPHIGCVGAKLLYGNNTVQHAGVICGLGNVAGHAHRYLPKDAPGYHGRLQSPQYYSAVTAACLLVRREVWYEVGGMNEELAVAYNDIDFCLKVKNAGYKNVYTPYAELYHHESISRGAEDSSEKLERYQREVDYMWDHWHDELTYDECYNPNLSRLREDFSL